MARPKSEEKKLAILDSAIHVIALHGLAAPTPLIARRAGVAEGTVFRYFPSKDELLNAVFLHLSRTLRRSLPVTLPADKSPEEQFRLSWNEYINWSIRHLTLSGVLNKLAGSDRISPQTRVQSEAMFPELHTLCQFCTRELSGVDSAAFFNAIFFHVAEVTIEFIARHPGDAETYQALGFRMLWQGVGG